MQRSENSVKFLILLILIVNIPPADTGTAISDRGLPSNFGILSSDSAVSYIPAQWPSADKINLKSIQLNYLAIGNILSTSKMNFEYTAGHSSFQRKPIAVYKFSLSVATADG